MEKRLRRADWHCHTHGSNMGFRDSTNFEDKLIDRALELDLAGIGITDHGTINRHVKCIKYLNELKKKAKDSGNLDHIEKIENFKLGLGTEIYLVDRDEISKLREKYESIKFYHLVVIAKNRRGHDGIRKLSSNSWENSFFYKGLERCPTYKDYFFEWAKKYGEDVIITTACLGSEFAQLTLEFINNPSALAKEKIIRFLLKMNQHFKENFYIEIQPSHFEEQISYNKLAIEIATAMNIKVVIDTDAHYLSKDKKLYHEIYLKSQDAERETEQFYASCYLMSITELEEYFPYIDKTQIKVFYENSLEIAEKIENYDLANDIKVPKSKIEIIDGMGSNIAPIVYQFRDQYEYIIKFGTSEHRADRILLQQIELGMIKKNIEPSKLVLDRLEEELKTLWVISEKLKQRLGNYYLLTKEVVKIIWQVSLLGVSRGSAGAFYICYLLEITQINPLDYNLPAWRHLSEERPELPDVDLDSEKAQRFNILNLLRENRGEKNVLNIATFKTEGTSSSIQTMCRGMGISTEEASYLSSLVIEGKTIKQTFENRGKDKDCATLIRELMQYEGLLEGVLEIEGLICGKSIHASGIYIFDDGYNSINSMMKAPNKQPITQFDMTDSDYMGGLKIDALTIEALDRIRKALDTMVDDGIYIKGKNLKETYDLNIHPDRINLDNEKMWQDLNRGVVANAFQYDSVAGRNAITTIHPVNFQQIMDGNALMRLSCDGEQPIQRYKKFKNNIGLWIQEMRDFGLESYEIETLKKHLIKSFGVASTQESVMRLAMDEKIAGFDLLWANKLRKAIAKAKAKDLFESVKENFFSNGMRIGNRKLILEYVWEKCIVPQLGYAFSEPHIAGYSLILLQEMNIHHKSRLHWDVACLSVDAGDIQGGNIKGTDYGAIAKAIGNMEKGFVLNPDINLSGLGFKANIKTGKALYGISAINGISQELSQELIKRRPYVSFQDFIERCVKEKVITNTKVINLIKAGCFDCFNNDRAKVMIEFIDYMVPNKTSLTTANIPKLVQFGLIDNKYYPNYCLYLFRKEVFTKENCSFMINKTQGVFRIGDMLKKCNIDTEFFNKYFIGSFAYDDEGNDCLNSKEFEKLYKIFQSEFNDWIKSEEALKRFNTYNKMEIWQKYCDGSIAKWEMDSISFYTNTHELEEIELSKFYETGNFKKLPSNPKAKLVKGTKGREYKRFDVYCIAGVVIEKNKNKSMITISTINGVVEVKMNKDTFIDYDNKKDGQESWFTKGTKLFLVGYRRGEVFVLKFYNDLIYQNMIMRINRNGEDIKLDYNRKSGEIFY